MSMLCHLIIFYVKPCEQPDFSDEKSLKNVAKHHFKYEKK